MTHEKGAAQPPRTWLAKLLGDAFRPGPPLTEVAVIPERRKAISLAAINVDLPAVAETHEGVFLRERGGHRLTAEIYVPPGKGSFPTVLFMHGGAWCVWGAADVRRMSMRLAAAGHLVISLDYGLAPEHPYPWAVEDAVYGARWAVVNGPRYGGDGGPIAVAGDSAGATLVSGAIAYLEGLEGTRLDEADLAGQRVEFSAALLLCGVYDFGAKLRERDTTPGTTEVMFNLAYLGTTFLSKHADPLVSPALAPNLSSFPPSYLNCGDEDALLPQTLGMTRALADAGVPTTLSVVSGVDHEFLLLDPKFPVVREEWRRALSWLCSHTGAEGLEAALAGLPVGESV